MSKHPRSFSIDEDINEILSNRDDLNASAAVNTFLREYVSSGKGEEAALEVRLNQLDEQIADKERELQKLNRERERIESQLESRRSELRDELLEMEAKIREGYFDPSNITPENPAIQKRASEAGISAQRFANKLQARL